MSALPVPQSAPRTAARIRWQAVHGLLLLDKPVGPSSNGALQRARRALCAAKGGHAGTLDPFASGLLPIALGEATKFLHDLLEADKSYEATLQLGVTTDTGDDTGAVLTHNAVTARDDAILEACQSFVGAIEQVPPMYSALKREGRPLYDYARAGLTVAREARPVHLHAISVLAIDRSIAARPVVRLRADVSKGTYLRVLAEDIGARLGCGAHLTGLRRLRIADLDLNDAVPLDALEAMTPEDRLSRMLPVDRLVASLPRIELDSERARRFLQGQRIILDPAQRPTEAQTPEGLVRVYQTPHLLGTALFSPPGLIAPQRVLAAPPHAATPS